MIYPIYNSWMWSCCVILTQYQCHINSTPVSKVTVKIQMSASAVILQWDKKFYLKKWSFYTYICNTYGLIFLILSKLNMFTLLPMCYVLRLCLHLDCLGFFQDNCCHLCYMNIDTAYHEQCKPESLCYMPKTLPHTTSLIVF